MAFDPHEYDAPVPPVRRTLWTDGRGNFSNHQTLTCNQQLSEEEAMRPIRRGNREIAARDCRRCRSQSRSGGDGNFRSEDQAAVKPLHFAPNKPVTLPSALDIAMKRAEGYQAIPPIIDPMGHSFRQPDRREILVDDTHAVMAKQAFERLEEYSCTDPTGTYVGKMWKRHDGAFDHKWRRQGNKPVWLLMWYGFDDKPGYVSRNWRIILLSDGELPE